MAHNCVGLFCEDIREESSGTHTIVGVMPDNLNLAGSPVDRADATVLFPKFGVYLRVNLDASLHPSASIKARLALPGTPDILLGEVSIEMIKIAFSDAKAKKFPIVGLIFKAVFSPLQLKESGIACLYAKIDEEDFVGAVLNMQIAK